MLKQKNNKDVNRKRNLLFLLLSGILFLFGCQTDGGVNLVKDGQAQAVIVTADEPSLIAAYAAEELAVHVKQATGVALPVVAVERLRHC